MPEQSDNRTRVNRRLVLKAGAYGFCTLCLAGIGGCALLPETNKTLPPESDAVEAGKGFIRARRSPWFEELGGGAARCLLCPRLCELAEGERSPCRVRQNRDGEVYTLVYGNPALVQEDPVERKPFFHVLPGSRALSISTAGCNLACEFCEVWDMALVKPEEIHAYDLPPEEVVKHALASGVRSVSYAFGEPVVFYEYMSEVAGYAREAGLLNLMHTAGYIRPEPLKEIAAKLDAVNFDLKGFEPEFYRRYVGGELEPVLDSLQRLREAGVFVEITSIVIPTLNDDPDQIGAMCRWIVDRLGADVPVHFARFYPLYRLSALPRTPVSSLDMARQTALDAGLEYVYIAKVTGHDGENTFCPGCGEIVIKRLGFVIEENRLENGNCSNCSYKLPGIWA